MKRILLHLAVSVLAFGLGVSVSALWRFYLPADEPQPFLADISKVLPFPLSEESISIECVSEESISIQCDADSKTYVYNLANGGYMMRTCQYFSYPAEANSILRERHGVWDVIERSEIFNSDGLRIGETVLVFEGGSAVRFIRYGELLCTTRASSVNDLRWFDHHEFHSIHRLGR